MARYSLTLTSDQRFVLNVWRDTHPSPEVRPSRRRHSGPLRRPSPQAWSSFSETALCNSLA